MRWELANLPGIRLAMAVEGDEWDALDPTIIKSVTGGDVIAAKRKHGHPFNFIPAFKLWIAVNHLPRVTGGDGELPKRDAKGSAIHRGDV